jgi:hypothetical protein
VFFVSAADGVSPAAAKAAALIQRTDAKTNVFDMTNSSAAHAAAQSIIERLNARRERPNWGLA